MLGDGEGYPKGGAVGNADGEVGEDGEEAVGGGILEGEVVGYLVDGEKEVLVRGCADDVGCQEVGEGEDGRVAEACCAGDL